MPSFDLRHLLGPAPRFRTQAETVPLIREACAAHPDLATCHDLGTSEEGRPLLGVTLGTGSRTVSLIAGAHADEPVGPETLRTFVLTGLQRREQLATLFTTFRFVLVPHINPDGEARNQPWIAQWPRYEAFLQHVVREQPGRDLEFGFPAMRPENRHVAAFLRAYAPYSLHMSLHGMAHSDGGMLLIERHWAGHTQALRDAFVARLRAEALTPHDHNRKGEKGFFYIEPGFTTTPEGAAMQAHFRALGDEATAGLFHQSSMEYVRSLGGDPLCLVTEMPLFHLPPDPDAPPGVPTAYLRFREKKPALLHALHHGASLAPERAALGLRPLALDTAMRLQLDALALGLADVE